MLVGMYDAVMNERYSIVCYFESQPPSEYLNFYVFIY